MDRYIYVGDIHGSKYFTDFISKYNDGKTKFILTGDLFDRGHFSVEVFLIIKDLHSKGLLELALGNHDIFFLLGLGILYEKENNSIKDKIGSNKKLLQYYPYAEIFYDQYRNNGGELTTNSFYNYYGENYYKQEINNAISYLFNNFNLYHIDELKNITIHGGLPILDNNIVIGEILNRDLNNNYYEGINYIKEFNRLFKELDISILQKLTANFHNNYIVNDIIEDIKYFKQIKNITGLKSLTYPKKFILTWYDNSFYENIKIKKTLKKELVKNGLNKLITGHWFNENKDFYNIKKEDYKTFIRLDRSFISGNFGYCIINNKNELLEINDIDNLFGINQNIIKINTLN